MWSWEEAARARNPLNKFHVEKKSPFFFKQLIQMDHLTLPLTVSFDLYTNSFGGYSTLQSWETV